MCTLRCVLDELKRRSGCRMDVVVKVPPGEMKYARIVGPPEAVRLVNCGVPGGRQFFYTLAARVMMSVWVYVVTVIMVVSK